VLDILEASKEARPKGLKKKNRDHTILHQIGAGER